MKKPWRSAAVALFVTALVLGGAFGDRLLALTNEVRAALRLYTELVATIQDGYGNEVSNRDLVYSSIYGMLGTLDPHTSFLTPESYEDMRERQQSSFYGLGILVGMRNGALTVITPLEGTPAHRLGIRAGDVISEIEGEPTEPLSLNDAVRKLKGPKGTEVHIRITRPGLDEPLDLTVVRDEIPQNSVRYAYMLTPEVGYIMLSDFTRATGEEMTRAVQQLREAGMKRLLLDLRGNGGGLLDQAIDTADIFLQPGAAIVETRGRTPESVQEYRAAGTHPRLEAPVVVLVSGATASAAEILAGAIQDHDTGLIAGTPTWGKGLVQTVYSLGYGAGLALTTAKYYTPSGRLIQRDYTSWFDYYEHAEPAPEQLAGDAYSTDLGRTVYGGGGITPDVEIAGTTVPDYHDHLSRHNAFFNFAVEYVASHPSISPEWTPGPEVLEQFERWIVTHDISTAEEVAAALADPVTADLVLHQVHAEIFSSLFGFEARHRVLAQIDNQIQEALGLFTQAADLLAQRQRLDREPTDARTAALGQSPGS